MIGDGLEGYLMCDRRWSGGVSNCDRWSGGLDKCDRRWSGGISNV